MQLAKRFARLTTRWIDAKGSVLDESPAEQREALECGALHRLPAWERRDATRHEPLPVVATCARGGLTLVTQTAWKAVHRMAEGHASAAPHSKALRAGYFDIVTKTLDIFPKGW